MIYKRVGNQKPIVGMTNFKGDYVTRDDVKIDKNYLSEDEMRMSGCNDSFLYDTVQSPQLSSRALKHPVPNCKNIFHQKIKKGMDKRLNFEKQML